jgi:hypothetical protein
MKHGMIYFIEGALMMGYGVAALFFLRFWRKTRDRLFVFFSVAFFMMATNRVALTLLERDVISVEETHHVLYLIRLLAFVLILIGIIDKNRAATGDARGRGSS